MITVIIFIFGLVVGSFLNAVIHRLSTKESVIVGRSYCPACKHELRPVDLIPVVSFILLAGRCRYCGKKISWQYPIVELITALTFVLLARNFSAGGGSAFGGQFSNFQFWFQSILACFFIVIGVFDFKHYLILDKVVFPALAISLVWAIVNGHFAAALIGAVIVAGFFALQYFASKGRWIGFGDVKFGLFLGSVFGIKLSIALLFISYILGAVVGIFLILLGRKKFGSRLPFGVFLSISAIIIMLWGSDLINWYLNLIGL